MSPIDVKALHERSPLYVQMSDGNIQNKWTIKVVNKSNFPMQAEITVEGPEGMTFVADKVITVAPGNVGATTLLVKIPKKLLTESRVPLKINVVDLNNPSIKATYESDFLGPPVR
jgi:polyferredoxin